ncbi:MAG: acyl-CoA dehydrogenase [Rhizobiaceae bacterium]|nr:MAG: acyl-CoA dehydrogenase [Rhizobiaceae bacterium]
MNLELSPDRIFMRDEARRLLASRCDSAALRRAVEAGGFDAGLWTTIGELGWCAVGIDEAAGGLGLGAMELALFAEECGRRLAPVPFWSTACLAAPVVAALAAEPARSELLARIAAGEAAAVALDLSATTAAGAVRATAGKDGDAWRLSGTIRGVPDLPVARIVLVPARAAGGTIALFAVERDGEGPRQAGFDLTRPIADLDLAAVAPSSFGLLAERVSAEAFDRALLTARLGLAAEEVGTAQGALDLTLAYIAGRVQFGRTIASFQAVKHRCAALLVGVTEARSLLHGAAASLDAGEPHAALEIEALGALAADIAFRAAEEAIQLHGGVGNTWEYDPHLFLRRAQATSFLFGTAAQKLETVAAAIIGDAA